MPKGGWTKTVSFFCDKFQTKISETIHKKDANPVLRTLNGSPAGVREFNREDGIKRLKTLDDIFKIASLKDTALRGRVNDQFINTWKFLSKSKITEVDPPEKFAR
ncbi:hypothetical protein NGRA_2732 [Nosema granulosis]|uniref:Uncharacterized protein n=1 Tax=Nosema granulosis TaxID=83296 RepID=A0A9P6GW31_9MICR|nr:hypothetical protein NGRA_2732 [Nosema granulosis]